MVFYKYDSGVESRFAVVPSAWGWNTQNQASELGLIALVNQVVGLNLNFPSLTD